MADGIWTEAVKFWGGLAGLGTAAFTIWDRAVRSRPWVEPHVVPSTAAPVGMRDADTPAYLRIHNPGRRAIGVQAIEFKDRRIARFALTGDVGRDVCPQRLLPIPAGASRLFEVMWVIEDDQDAEAMAWVVIRWRPLAAIFPRVPLLMRTSAAALTRLQDAEAQRMQDEAEARRLRTAPILVEPGRG